MTSARLLTAMALAACALVASVLVAIPTDGPDPLGDAASVTATIAPAKTDGAAYRPATRSLQPADDQHGALPRLWLGGAR
jgi:hypothetical protein